MAVFIAHRINSAHIDKLRDISCLILAAEFSRELALKAMLEDINDSLGYMAQDDETPAEVTEAHLTFNETDGAQEYFYDSELCGQTWTLSTFTDKYITVV